MVNDHHYSLVHGSIDFHYQPLSTIHLELSSSMESLLHVINHCGPFLKNGFWHLLTIGVSAINHHEPPLTIIKSSHQKPFFTIWWYMIFTLSPRNLSCAAAHAGRRYGGRGTLKLGTLRRAGVPGTQGLRRGVWSGWLVVRWLVS